MKQWKSLIIVLIIPFASLVIALFTLDHYGINWDEPYHYRRGQAFLQFFLTRQKTYDNLPKYPALKGDSDNPDFRNSQDNFIAVQKNPSLSDPNFRRSFYQDDSWNGEFFIDMENTYGHPALNDILAALSNKIFYQTFGILGDLESYRFFIIIIVSLTTFIIAVFMWKEFGIVESVITSLTLTTYPLILGEQHFNIKDPIEASFFALTIVVGYLGIKKDKLIWLLLSILFFSLGLATKFNIVFSIPPLLVWFVFFVFQKKMNSKNIKLALLIAPFVAIGILFVSFPTLWKNPAEGFENIIRFYLEAGYPKSQPEGIYLLNFFNAYPSLWILYTTPPVVLVLFFTSIILSVRLIKKNSFAFLLFLWIAISIGRNSLFGALSYGGVRLIMEYIPALAMLTGLTVGYIAKANKKKFFYVFFPALIFTAFIPTFIKLVNIHPNENVYFNFIAGGLGGAKEKNLPSWGDSYGNAYYLGILWLNQNAESNAKVTIPVGNTSNIPRFKLRPDIAVSPNYWSGLKHDGEYLIELTYDYTPSDWFVLKYLNQAMVPVYEVKVDGITIAKVWKNDYAHVRDEYKQTRDLSAKIDVNVKNKSVRLEIANPQRILKVQMAVPIDNCDALKTGFVTLSTDGKSWVRESEDIAREQLDRQKIKKLSPVYEFYFMAQTAKIIEFNVDSENSCLLKATDATLTVL